MSNAAYSVQYKQIWGKYRQLFIADYLKESEDHDLTHGYSVRVSEYTGRVDDCNMTASQCSLTDANGKIVAKWRSIDNDGDFYQIIHHSNGNLYLIFRQDLYGYSVLDIATGEIMQFFPKASLNGEETFIWTDVNYNERTNVLAVSGCYWACPFSTLLFSFDNPMSEHQKYVDLTECFDGGYGIYYDTNFVKWENGNLHVIRYVVETRSQEALVVKQEEYLTWLFEKGKEL